MHKPPRRPWHAGAWLLPAAFGAGDTKLAAAISASARAEPAARVGVGGRGAGEGGGWQPPTWSHGMLFAPQVKCYGSVEGTIYDYGALTIDGDEYVPFRKYAGKMVLFVNVATY